jgi:aspartyl aminopeptidase
MTALLEAGPAAATNVCAFFDHEEVGSESAAGAGGNHFRLMGGNGLHRIISW